MSAGKICLIALGSGVIGGLIVVAFFGGQVQRVAESLTAMVIQSPKSQSPMISGFNRPLVKDM